MNLFLIGFMGAGKSTAAGVLQREYGMHRIEMDDEIEAREGRTISRIFSESGETYFRDLETAFLESLQQKENCVISCGGGAVLRPENPEIMRKSGWIVYLSASAETICERLKGTHTRPLLEGHMNEEDIGAMLRERLPKYQAAADFTVETDGKDILQICEEILFRTQNNHRSVLK